MTKAIVQLVHDLLGEGEAAAKPYRDIAEINESFTNNDQWGSVVVSSDSTHVNKKDWFDTENNVPHIYINHTANLVAVKAALHTKNRPCAIARAEHDDVDDVYASEVMNAAVRYTVVKQDTAKHTKQMSRLSGKHGSGGIKVWFDTETRDVRWAPVSIFQVTLDPWAHDSVDDAEWIIFHRWLSKKQARKAFAKAGSEYANREPTVEEYKAASGSKVQGVKAYELWHKPCDDYPQGLYAFIVADVCVEEMAFPYFTTNDAGERECIMPLVWMKDRIIDECAYGGTSTTAAIPLQRTLNEVVARIVKIVRIESNPQLVGTTEAIDKIDVTKDTKIGHPNSELGIKAAAATHYLQTPRVSPEHFAMRDWLIEQIHEIMGVNQITAGTETRTLSGRAVEEVAGLDEQKNADTTTSLQAATVAAHRKSAQLMQQFYEDGRKSEIFGVDGAEVWLFNRADLSARNVRLEPGSEFDLFQPVAEGIALERQQKGIGSAGDVQAAARDPGAAASKAYGERLVKEALAGKTIEIGPDDAKLPTVIEVVRRHKRLAALEGRRKDFDDLHALEGFLRELEGQAADVAPPPGPAPAPPPGQRPATPPQRAQGAPLPPRPAL